MQKFSPHLKICWLLEGSSSSQGIFGPKGVFPLQKHLSWQEHSAHTPLQFGKVTGVLPTEGGAQERRTEAREEGFGPSPVPRVGSRPAVSLSDSVPESCS